jgi:hypothetical protein
MPKKLPSIEYLHKALYYDPVKGEFFWRERTPDMFLHKGALSADRKCNHWNSKHANTRAFTRGRFVTGSVDGIPCKVAHVAWAIARGVWPREAGVIIFHKNGDETDNRMRNLRRRPERTPSAFCAHNEIVKEALEWRPDPSPTSGNQSD